MSAYLSSVVGLYEKKISGDVGFSFWPFAFLHVFVLFNIFFIYYYIILLLTSKATYICGIGSKVSDLLNCSHLIIIKFDESLY